MRRAPRLPLAQLQPYLIDLPLMVVLISLIYSATHYDQWGPILREAVRCGLRRGPGGCRLPRSCGRHRQC